MDEVHIIVNRLYRTICAQRGTRRETLPGLLRTGVRTQQTQGHRAHTGLLQVTVVGTTHHGHAGKDRRCAAVDRRADRHVGRSSVS